MSKSASTADISDAGTAPVSAAEAEVLFAALERARGLLLAVSGGPDSTALLWLVARWCHAREVCPPILALTVDHGLRPEARQEAAAVKRIAKQCGIAHRTLHWSESKPKAGLQRAARAARYRLLAEAARDFGADYILTAHTLDDQAETLLIRMSRGSGLAGLCAMARSAPVPAANAQGIILFRPFLDVPKARLVATLQQAGIGFADDPSNRDPRFGRTRMRALMPILRREGLSAARLGLLAARLRRAEAAIEAAVEAAWDRHARTRADGCTEITFDHDFAALPAEVRLRLLGRAIALIGNEGPVELAKLEVLHQAVTTAVATRVRLRRTLAGAVVSAGQARLSVERAPPRRRRCNRSHGQALNQRATLPPQSGQTALE